jgi:hypothetical protein
MPDFDSFAIMAAPAGAFARMASKTSYYGVEVCQKLKTPKKLAECSKNLSRCTGQHIVVE